MSTSNIEQTKENYDVTDFVAAEAELQELREKYNISDEKKTFFLEKIGDKYAEYKDSIKPVTVNKKKYCLTTLFLGWLGVHQFIIGKRIAGILYLLVSWTGISFAMSVLDLFYAVFLKVDENNCITI